MNTEPEVKEEVVREPSQELNIKRSMLPLYLNLFNTFIILGILLFIFILIMFLIASYVGDLALPINIIVVTLLVGFYLVYFSLSFLNYKSISYTIIPGSIQQTTLNTIDQIPGKILVKEGFFHRQKIMLTMNDFDHIKIEKSFTGRAYNYGHVYLVQKDELDMTQNYVLTNIYDPEEAAKLIQKMIDVEIFKSTPTRSNTSGRDENKNN